MVKGQSRGLLATTRPLLPRLLQLPIALRVDRGLPTHEHVVRRHVPNRAVKPDVVVVIHISCVRSVILTDERFLHFQLRQDNPEQREGSEGCPATALSVVQAIP